MLRSGESVAGKTFVLVDLRRNDHEVGHTRQDFLYKMIATGYFVGVNNAPVADKLLS